MVSRAAEKRGFEIWVGVCSTEEGGTSLSRENHHEKVKRHIKEDKVERKQRDQNLTGAGRIWDAGGHGNAFMTISQIPMMELYWRCVLKRTS